MKKIFFAFLIWSSSSSALVDMKNANFSDYWVDFSLAGSGYDLKIDRKYSSRSLFSGIFGFGWCSTIENHLDITLEGNLVLQDCDGGLNVSYYPANYNTQLINDSVDKIIVLLKRKDSEKPKSHFEDLRDRLRQDHKLRTQLAAEVGFKITPTKNTVFLANGKDVDRITFDGESYVRTMPDGVVQKFDTKGSLVTMTDRAKNWIRISYTNNLPSQIIDNQNRKFTFSYTPEGKVKQIFAPSNSSMTYKFSGEDLVGVTNAWKNSYVYDYDQGHNLSKISYPDGTYKAISYIESKDWVKQFRDRDGCLESFEFTMSPSDPKNHYWSTASKNCKGKVVTKSRYEFWYQSRPDREKYLSRVVTERNNDIVDISYHQDFAKPIAIRHNASVITLQYYPNGLVKSKTVSGPEAQTADQEKYTISFDYDSANRITETNTESFAKGGKSTHKKKTVYKYDVAGRLVSAKNSDGQYVDIKYNSLGLISEISDQAKKEIAIEYDQKTMRPSTIIRPSVGSISLTYDAKGEIAKIKNKGGPTVTAQVRTTYNNFVDIVGPVTSELNLVL